MSRSEEVCALQKRIDRVLNAIPILKQRLAAQREQDAQPATSKRTRRRRRALPPGVIQLSLFSWQDQAGDGDQAQAG